MTTNCNLKKIESLKKVVVLTTVKNMMADYFDQCYDHVTKTKK